MVLGSDAACESERAAGTGCRVDALGCGRYLVELARGARRALPRRALPVELSRALRRAFACHERRAHLPASALRRSASEPFAACDLASGDSGRVGRLMAACALEGCPRGRRETSIYCSDGCRARQARVRRQALADAARAAGFDVKKLDRPKGVCAYCGSATSPRRIYCSADCGARFVHSEMEAAGARLVQTTERQCLRCGGWFAVRRARGRPPARCGACEPASLSPVVKSKCRSCGSWFRLLRDEVPRPRRCARCRAAGSFSRARSEVRR